MTIETDLHAALATCCDRVFADFAETSTQRPYVTYQQIGGQALNYVEGTTPDHKHGEFQVNVWADTRISAAALALAIEAAMRAATAFTAQPMAAPVSDFDADMRRYGSRQDFSIFSSR
jgi:hypothetical protein